MSKAPYHVSVGITCFNEEKTIASLVTAVLNQYQNAYTLDNIYVLSDGSTDTTVSTCEKIADKRLKVIAEKERKGKAVRINQLLTLMKGDIIVFLDADISINSNSIIAELITPFISDKMVALVGGNPKPLPGKTFIEQAVNLTYDAYAPLRTIRDNSTPYGCDGKVLALRNEFAKNITIPETMIGIDSYLYFVCKQKGYAFKHVPTAVVYYHSPSTLRDQIRQNTRFIGAEYLHEQVFGSFVRDEYKIPFRMLPSIFIKTYLRHPLQASIIFLVNRYCAYKAKKQYHKIPATWEMVSSTKHL